MREQRPRAHRQAREARGRVHHPRRRARPRLRVATAGGVAFMPLLGLYNYG